MPRDDVAPDAVKIRLTGVAKRFATRDREVQALQPIDLTVRDHEFVALVGPSGCGKSTILNLVAGLLAPSEGRIWYDGEPVNGLNRNVGYMTQKDTLLPWRSAADNIRIALELKCRAVPRREAQERVAQMIALVGLTGFRQLDFGLADLLQSGGYCRGLGVGSVACLGEDEQLAGTRHCAVAFGGYERVRRDFRANRKDLSLDGMDVRHGCSPPFSLMLTTQPGRASSRRDCNR